MIYDLSCLISRYDILIYLLDDPRDFSAIAVVYEDKQRIVDLE